MIESSVTTLGMQIAKYRRLAKVSAEELAQRAGNGLTRSMLANLENGRKKDLTTTQLIAVAVSLGVSPADLLVDLFDPYRIEDIELGEATISPAQLHLYRWIGGRAFVTELQNMDVAIFDNSLSAFTVTQVFDLLIERQERMARLGRLEEYIAAVEAREAFTGDERWWNMPGSAEDAAKERDTIMARLYEIDRHLRNAGVKIDREIVMPGTPF